MKRAILILSALAALSLQTYAQTMQFMTIQSSPEAAALAGACVARHADGFALESNAAAMVQDSVEFAAGISYGSWKPASTLAGGAFYTKMGGNMALGADFKYLGGQTYNAMDENGKPLGSFTPADMYGAVGIAYGFSEKLSAAVIGFFVSSSLAEGANATAFGANLSLRYTDGPLSAGLSLDNLGTKPDYGYGPYSLPAMAKVGAAYSKNGFTALAEADYLFAGAFMAALAAEYSLYDTVSLSAGYHYGADKAPSIPSYLSAGLGLKLGALKLNAAYLLASETLQGSWLAGIGLQF